MHVAETAGLGPRRDAWLRVLRSPATRRWALAAYLFALGLWSLRYGIPVQRELVVAWTCGALVVLSLGRPPRRILEIVVDWLPLLLVLAAYDLTRGIADSLGMGVHVTTMIEVDRFLFGGQAPTEWIQANLWFYESGALDPWDVLFSVVYTSYFIVPFALAGWLWSRSRAAFRSFAKRLVTLSIAGLATYILFPAAPPWMAADQGLLDGVTRTTSEGFLFLGVETVGLFSKAQYAGNLVAAVPSLHAGITALVAMFLFSRVRPSLRPIVVAYPLAMALTLMATGEHYFFDVILGWTYAAAVMACWAIWDARRADARVRRRRLESADASRPAAETRS